MTNIFPTSNPPEGFESGNFSAWSGTVGSPTIETANAHHGTYNAKFTSSGSYAYENISANSTVYLRAYVKVSAVPSSNGQTISLMTLGNGVGDLVELRIIRSSNANYWQLRNFVDYNPTEYNESSASNPSAGQYYRVEILREPSRVALWVGDDQQSRIDQYDENMQYQNTKFCVGNLVADISTTVYVDCVIAADAYIGPEGGGGASKLAYTAGSSQTITAGSVSSVITVQVQDSNGNPVTTGATVNLSTSAPSSGHFYSDSGGNNQITSVTISSGQSSGNFYYKDTIASTSTTLTASATGLTSAQTTFTIQSGTASKLAYTAGTNQTIQVNAVSSVITVQVQDSYGNPVTTGTTVNLSISGSSTGHFYSDSGGNNQITSVTISSGQHSGNFYYKDTSAGYPQLTASATGLTSAQTQFTIQSSGSGHEATHRANGSDAIAGPLADAAIPNISASKIVDGTLNLTSELKLNNNSGNSGQVLTSSGSGNTPTWQTVTPSNLGGSGSIPSGWIVPGARVSGDISGNAASITGTILHDKISDWTTATSSFVTPNSSVTLSGLEISGSLSLFGGLIPITSGSLTINSAVATIKNSLDDGSGNASWGGISSFKDIGKTLNVHWDPNPNHTGWAEETPPIVPYSYAQGHNYEPTENASLLWCTTVSPLDRSTPIGDPVLQTNFAFRVEKDMQSFGFIGTSSDPQKRTGGGAILMGQGFIGDGCPPIFSLTGTMIFPSVGDAEEKFPGTAHGLFASRPAPAGDRKKYYQTDDHYQTGEPAGLYEDTPIYNSSGQIIDQEWQFRGTAGSIGKYPTTNNGAYWYNSANKNLMHDITIAAPYVQSDKYDTLFLISGESSLAPFTLSNLYLNKLQCNKICNAQNSWIEIDSNSWIEINAKLNLNGNFQLNGSVVTSLNPDPSTPGIGLGSGEEYWSGVVAAALYPRDPIRQSSPYSGKIKFDGANNRIVFRNETDTGYVMLDSNCYTGGGGSGDMLKSTYDTDNDGVVDNSEAVGGYVATALEKTVNKGVANGYASLDGSVLVPLTQIPTITASKINSSGLDADTLDGHHGSYYMWNGGIVTADVTIQKSNPILKLDATNGKIQFYNDYANLFRDSSNTLKTDGNLTVSQALWCSGLAVDNNMGIGGHAAVGGNLYVGGTTTSHVFSVNSSGEMYFGNGSSWIASMYIDSSQHLYIANQGTGAVIINSASSYVNVPCTFYVGVISGSHTYISGDNVYLGHIKSFDSTYVTVDDTFYTSGGIFPSTPNNQDCGSVNFHWGAVRGDYLLYDIDHYSFDALDDLTLVKNYRTKIEKRKTKNGEEIDVSVIDKQSLSFLLDEDGFHSINKTNGFLLGCVKALVIEIDTLKARLNKIETNS